MRTLVVSDLHLGARGGADVLREAEARGALIGALPAYDRLVLLGDLIELRHGPVREALVAAQDVLRAIGTALGAGGEVVIVPGNHDHHLLAGWLERRALGGLAAPGSVAAVPPLGLESAVDWRDGEPLAVLAARLAPAAVRVAYPGVWLREDVYATHGHYGDRHTTVPMFERVGAGAMARIVHEPEGGPRRAEDYESALEPIYAWIHALAQAEGGERRPRTHGYSARAWQLLAGDHGRRGWRQRALVAAFGVLVALLNSAQLGPLRADLSGVQLRRGALEGFGEVLERLEIAAPYVIFGHTHRAGPLAGDDRSEWRAPTGAALVNTGCWVHEPAFLGADPSASPYRAGFAAILDETGPPELMCLLDRS